jgi:hypothetical protein
MTSISALIEGAFRNKQTSSEVLSELSKIGSEYALSTEVVCQTVLRKVDELSQEEPLELAAANYLYQLCENICGNPDKIQPKSPSYRTYRPTLCNVTLSRTLWLIMHGKKPLELPTPCEFVLQPGENRLMEFGTVLYRKSVMVSSRAGGYHGIGVRVASGRYYRFGGYAGHPVSSEVQYLDNGFLALTNKSFYFGGQHETFRIPYSSILRFKAYPDGLGFFRGIGGGKEELFTVVDSVLSSTSGAPYNPKNAVTLYVGWFLYNLVTFLTTSKQ